MNNIILFLCFVLFTCYISLISSNIINISSGPISGILLNNVQVYRGIPYAAPPIGNNRFHRPKPVESWYNTLNCWFDGYICPQFKLFQGIPFYIGNEDCLTLNVYTPHNAIPGQKLPVVVWIYGGGYVLGDKTEFGLYDPIHLVNSHGYIFVAMNYRLGSLGFMTLDEIRDEDPYYSAGNQALLDQQYALQWVQTNIAAFGGDPNRVTIFGESAGAFSVCWHLVAPQSQGLFQSAILESGTCDSPEFFVDYSDNRDWSYTYSSMVGCKDTNNTLDCLRKLSTGQILNGAFTESIRHVDQLFDEIPLAFQSKKNGFASNTSITMEQAIKYNTEQRLAYATLLQENRQNTKIEDELYAYAKLFKSRTDILKSSSINDSGATPYVPPLFPIMPFGPTIDGSALLSLPLDSIREGSWAKVPVIMGTNQNEGTIFVPALYLLVKGLHFPIRDSDLYPTLMHFFNQNATIVNQIVSAYPPSAYNSTFQLTADLLRDYFFACSSRRAVKTISSQVNQTAWLYHFDYRGDWIDDWLLGDYHSSELEFVFDNAWPPILHIFSKNDATMASEFGAYWSNMVHYNNPNGASCSVPEYWPNYNSSSEYNIVLQQPCNLQRDLFESQCQFWDNIFKQTQQDKSQQRIQLQQLVQQAIANKHRKQV